MRPFPIGPEGTLVAAAVLAVAGCRGHVRPGSYDVTVAGAVGSGGRRATTPPDVAGVRKPGDRAWDRTVAPGAPGARGAGVTVYLIDSGIRLAHREFAAGRASVGGDFVGDGRGGRDCNGHGTHAAGVVGGATYGLAPGVRLVALRVADCSGRVDDAALFAALEWVAGPERVRRPAIVNFSLSTDVAQSAPRAVARLEDAVRRILDNGVTVVAAAGNQSADACGGTPGRIGPVITVSAIDDRGPADGDSAATATARAARLRGANYGRCVDLFAPGGRIRSAWWTGSRATRVESGTSSATAFVTGAAALYLGCNPAASPGEVAGALLGDAAGGEVIDAGPGSPDRRRLSRVAALAAASRTACVAPAVTSSTR